MDANDLEDEKIQPTIEVYRERWIILMIYILCTCLSSTQWIEYSIITNVVMKYYDVSASTVDWTSMSFAIMWPILVFPASYIIDKMGLRVAVLIGILSTALGSGVKVFSVGENSFYVVILGQLIVAASQIFLLNLPSKLSVVWFKPEEISTVCSLGILGLTSGTAISYFVPPIMVRDSDNMDEVADDFRVMNWGVFLLSIPLVLIVFFCSGDIQVDIMFFVHLNGNSDETIESGMFKMNWARQHMGSKPNGLKTKWAQQLSISATEGCSAKR
nr:uncharacterized MFS-type transporter C09D4.1-like [Leptinotarsa decemlineata]